MQKCVFFFKGQNSMITYFEKNWQDSASDFNYKQRFTNYFGKDIHVRLFFQLLVFIFCSSFLVEFLLMN